MIIMKKTKKTMRLGMTKRTKPTVPIRAVDASTDDDCIIASFFGMRIVVVFVLVQRLIEFCSDRIVLFGPVEILFPTRETDLRPTLHRRDVVNKIDGFYSSRNAGLDKREYLKSHHIPKRNGIASQLAESHRNEHSPPHEHHRNQTRTRNRNASKQTSYRKEYSHNKHD